jgi:K+-transporting ATPase ATPase C chain
MKRIKDNIDGRRNPARSYNGHREDSLGNLIRRNLGPSIRVVILSMLVFGIAYPLVLIGIGQGLLPFQSNGSQVAMDGKNPVGSILIGQEFTSPKFLHIRPAAQTASGVDPHITPEDAFAQAENVSKATGIPVNTITTLIELNIERNRIENLIVFAPHYVNVLEVNMELVRQYPEIYTEFANSTMNIQRGDI